MVERFLARSRGSGNVNSLRLQLVMLVVTVVLLASQMTQAIAQEQDQSVNVLFILADQLRYDAIGYVQSRLPEYEGKLRVRTPNLDRLASMGITFGTAYCQYASCSQARATLKTGCTVGRHGVTHNYLANKEIYERMSIFKERIERLQSFEQILGQYKNYTVETYGKWHVPLVWYGRNGTVRSTYYSYADNAFRFALDMLFTSRYRESLRYFNASVRASLQNTNEPGNPMLRNRYSTFPYTPIQLDYRRMIREGANSHHRWLGGDSEDRSFSGSIESTNHHYYFSKKDMALRPMDDTEVDSDSPTNPTSPALTRGRDSLAANYTSTAIEGDMALRALNRLLKEETMNPFFLSVHFNSPHPPMVATSVYLDYYWNRRSQLCLPANQNDPLTYSAYRKNKNHRLGQAEPDKLSELIAVYYSLIEEIDHYVGLLLKMLEEGGALGKTMIIFTSDHGEMMGSHGMQDKNMFYEEATRVPLIVANPAQFPPSSAGRVVTEPVSHLDVHATILDYLGASEHSVSDGSSLRRYVERSSFNELYDEAIVVAEADNRYPIDSTKLSSDIGRIPNFMIRKGPFKLMLPRKADSPVIDMMFDLGNDPGEVVNLLRDPIASQRLPKSAIIGKAEHLKALLMEFLRRHDGDGKYYTSPRYHMAGRGDLTEIRLRRTWDAVDYWQSDRTLEFGTPALVHAEYVRNEYLYIGTTKGSLNITNIAVIGPDSDYFQVSSPIRNHLDRNQNLRLRVSFRSSALLSWTSLSASLVITNSATGTAKVPMFFAE